MTDSTRRVLGGRYELHSLLATGGMGRVWRGRDTLLDRPVAVKLLRSEYSDDPTFLSRFRAEAHHAAGLLHPNIATLFDYGEAPAEDENGEARAYLVMELVEGEPLSAVLARAGRLDPARTLDLLRQTAAGLTVAHAAGVVHRDVKPGNILVGDDGIVRITDFGIAWSASSVPLTLTGQVVGTPHYLPPEQAAGDPACPAGDVYSLGMIGYECLAGRRAFEGENAVQIALRQLRDTPDPLPPHVPDDVRALIGRALLKDPAERFADGAAFRDAIETVQAGRPLPPLPEGGGTTALAAPGTAPAARRSRRRARALVPLAAVLAGAGIALAGVQAGAPPGAPAAAAGTGTTAGVLLVAADYLGRPVDDVEAELGALGLRVERRAEPTAAAATGAVTAIGPTGAVPSGDLVVVTYAVAPAAGPQPAPDPGPVQQAVAPAPASAAQDPAREDTPHADAGEGDAVGREDPLPTRDGGNAPGQDRGGTGNGNGGGNNGNAGSNGGGSNGRGNGG